MDFWDWMRGDRSSVEGENVLSNEIRSLDQGVEFRFPLGTMAELELLEHGVVVRD